MDNLENKIKKEIDDYVIKTKSSDIISKYDIIECKKKNNKLFISLSSVFTLAIAVFAFLMIYNPQIQYMDPVMTVSNTLNDSSIMSTLSMELKCISLFDTVSNNQITYASNGDINKAIDNYDEVHYAIDSFFVNSYGLESEFIMKEFKYDSEIYNYVFSSNDDAIYLNKDIRNIKKCQIDVLLFVNKEYYDAKLEIREKEEKYEMNLEYYKESSLITIEKEYYDKKYEIKYEINNKDYEITHILSFDYDGNEASQEELVCNYECIINNQRFSYIITSIDDFYSIIYNNRYQIMMKKDNGKRVYIYDEEIFEKK